MRVKISFYQCSCWWASLVSVGKKFLWTEVCEEVHTPTKTLKTDKISQAADYYSTRMGFQKFGYSGLETGSRNVVSWIVKQNDVSRFITCFGIINIFILFIFGITTWLLFRIITLSDLPLWFSSKFIALKLMPQVVPSTWDKFPCFNSYS